MIVGPEDAGLRLDVFVSKRRVDLSRALVQKMIVAGQLTLDGRPARANSRVKSGDVVDVPERPPPSLTAKPEPVALNIVYEDTCIAVIDKPAGLVVHPSPGHEGGTLVNGLLDLYPSLRSDESARPGLVHRLDKDTSGLMVVALTAEAQKALTQALAARAIQRRYVALVWGDLRPDRALIDVPVGRDAASRKKMSAAAGSIRPRPARTRYEVLERLGEFTLAEVALDTGRTHQIRVHMAYIGHPVVGDPTYSNRKALGLTRQFLHAHRLELTSPCTGECLQLSSELPGELKAVLDGVRTDGVERADEYMK